MRRICTLSFSFVACLLYAGTVCGGEPTQVGVAKVDITPTHPVVLAGYGGRTEEFDGVDQKLWARAMAIGEMDPVLVIAVDNCGVPKKVVEHVAARLLEKKGLRRERFVVCSTHTHNAPSLRDYAPILWADRTTEAQELRIDQYTQWLQNQIFEVGIQALAARVPATLSWSQGRLKFGANRRVLADAQWRGFGFQMDGPVDHSFPVLVASSTAGEPVGIWANYACHCTTVGSRNRIGGDWAGYANESIEKRWPGLISLVTIGCGADVGPQPSGTPEIAQQHGETLALEVERILDSELTSLPADISASMATIDLPFAEIPTRESFQKTASLQNFDGANARNLLAIHEEKGAFPQSLEYPISCWKFGDKLCMVFMAGEVVVDYAVRLKTELDWERTWIHGWSHDVPGYIPSRRVLAEGGYEADFSQVYYGHPTRYAPEVEDLVIAEVKRQAGRKFFSEMPDKRPDFFRVPGAQERYEERIEEWVKALSPKDQVHYRQLFNFSNESTSAYARLVSNDGGVDRWFNYSGYQEDRPYIRQQKVGDRIVWETPPISGPEDGSPVTMLFLAGVGWQSQPETDGFKLSIEGRSPLHFDVSLSPRQWKSAEGDVELHFFPTWISDLDAAGLFYLVMPSRGMSDGMPLEIAVESMGEGSRRWFSLDLIQKVKPIESKLVEAVRSLGDLPEQGDR